MQDPCFLVTGNVYMAPGNRNLTMTAHQFRAQMSLWALMASPLIISADVRSPTALQMEILGNKAVVAVNQDALGTPGRIVLGRWAPPKPPPPGPPLPPPPGPRCCCCWNRVKQSCNSTSQCDPGGEGCVHDGFLTKKYGRVTCTTCDAHSCPGAPPPAPSAPCAFPALRANQSYRGCATSGDDCAWQFCCPEGWSSSGYGAQAGKSCGTGRNPSSTDPTWGNRATSCVANGGAVSREGSAEKWTCALKTAAWGVARNQRVVLPSAVQVWARNLSSGDVALAVYNNGGNASVSFTVPYADVPGLTHKVQSCKSLWSGQPAASAAGLSGTLEPWQCLLYRCYTVGSTTARSVKTDDSILA